MIMGFYIEGVYLGSSSINPVYGNHCSRIFYCSVCGFVFGKCVIQDPDYRLGYGSAPGICQGCKSNSRYDIPGGIPFFTELITYPEQVIAFQLDRELENFYARHGLDFEASVYTPRNEYALNGA